jgi:hypothetical protein
VKLWNLSNLMPHLMGHESWKNNYKNKDKRKDSKYSYDVKNKKQDLSRIITIGTYIN